MCVQFIVGSEEELTSGVEWCELLCRVRGASVHVVVPGPDRKTLAELARRRMSERLGSEGEKVHVELVDADPMAVVNYARSAACQALLMVYRDDHAKFQRQLFEESRIPSLWIRPCGPPPASAKEPRAMFRRPSRNSSIASQTLLGFVAEVTLCENVHAKAEDLVAAARSAIEAASGPGGLVLCDVEHTNSGDRVYQASLSLLAQASDWSIALIHPGDTVLQAAAAKIRHWAESVAPPMEREERIQLAKDLQTGSQPNLEYLGLISAAAMLASFGLLQNSASVIIGAMLIAPLMTPILGAGLC